MVKTVRKIGIKENFFNMKKPTKIQVEILLKGESLGAPG